MNIYDILPIKPIESIQYGILSPEEVAKMSYVLIENTSGVDNNIFKPNSAYDLNLGTISDRHKCGTCRANKKIECGHYGYIKLTKPVFNSIFIKWIFKILKCICLKCGVFLISEDFFPEILNLGKVKRLDKCVSLALKKECKSCHFLNPTFVLENVQAIHYYEPGKFKKDPETKKTYMPPELVLEKFRKLSDREIEVLGFSSVYSRPEWMILSNLLVIPPTNRPILMDMKNNKSEDNMFKLYTHIIKFNIALAKEIEKLGRSPTLDDYQKSKDGFRSNFDTLTFAVSTLMTDKGKSGSVILIRGTPTKSIKEFLKGKAGFIRGTCGGKRVDYSSRSVISPEANCNTDTFGIPLYIAKILTFPEKVTPYNIDYLRSLIRAGDEAYPGAAKIITRLGVPEGPLLYYPANQIRY